ncbi:MAG: transcriptional regulator NrdR [Elusimicrobiota bacterium]
MRCPFCHVDSDIVIDSRPLDNSSVVRRRRTCKSCNRRFTTYERVETPPLIVIKSNNRREMFNIDKLRGGILRACEKRPIPAAVIERLISEIEYEIGKTYLMEVKSNIIGRKVLDKLRAVDEVAYIRFASVYRNYDTIDEFLDEITKIKQALKLEKVKDKEKEKEKETTAAGK